MKIAHNSVVNFDYTLRDSEGEVIDSSDGDEPMTYLHGHGQIVPGLEAEMEGRSAGAQFEVVVSAASGYGDYDPERVVRVPRGQIPSGVDLTPGAAVHAENENGEVVELTVVSENPQEVVLDANHPLAGVDLYFSVTVRDVRSATVEELRHGHAHGPGGHHH